MTVTSKPQDSVGDEGDGDDDERPSRAMWINEMLTMYDPDDPDSYIQMDEQHTVDEEQP